MVCVCNLHAIFEYDCVGSIMEGSLTPAFAALSAALFPMMSVCPGNQAMLTTRLGIQSSRSMMLVWNSSKHCCAGWIDGLKMTLSDEVLSE